MKSAFAFNLPKDQEMSTSKLQYVTTQHIRQLFAGLLIKYNYRPDWLVNPVTERKLEIDIYVYDLKIGIEVQDGQHTKYTPFFHKGEDDFKAQVQRDEIKRHMLKEYGVRLYEIYKRADIEQMLDDMKSYNAELSHLVRDRNTSYTGLQNYMYEYGEELKKRNRDTKRIESLVSKIEHLVRKYDFSLKEVTPRKVSQAELAFNSCPIVLIKHTEAREWTEGAMFDVRPHRVAVAMPRKGMENNGKREFYFDRYTGKQTNGGSWFLDLNSLPENLRFTDEEYFSEMGYVR